MDTILYFQSPSKTSAPDKISGVRRHASAANWHVQVVDGIPSRSALKQLVDFWHPVGAIVECGGGYQEIPTDLFDFLPTVYLDRNPRILPSNAHCVSHDSVATGRLAAKELLLTGFHSFAFVPYPQPRFWSDDRERGFKDALALNGLTCETFAGGRHSPQSVVWQKALRCWVTQLPKPCGIFAANDSIAAEVLTAAAHAELDVPREIAVCGVDNFAPICESTTPSLTSVQPDFTGEGRLAAELLDRMMEGEPPVRRESAVGIRTIVARDSTAAQSQAGRFVQRVLAYIGREATSGIGVGDVAKRFKVSPSLLELRFRQFQKESLYSAILRIRLEEVRRRLRETDAPIEQITFDCGWENPLPPKVLFKKRFGVTMREWRCGN